MSGSFFNTPGLADADLAHAESMADQQNAAVLRIFKDNAPLALAPSEVWQASSIELLTSVRRSISTLTKRGQLVKTSDQLPGPHGVPEYLWTLAA